MLFIGVEVEQETSAPLPKKILDPPLVMGYIFHQHQHLFVHLLRSSTRFFA